jgi:hypothetical protein
MKPLRKNIEAAFLLAQPQDFAMSLQCDVFEVRNLLETYNTIPEVPKEEAEKASSKTILCMAPHPVSSTFFVNLLLQLPPTIPSTDHHHHHHHHRHHPPIPTTPQPPPSTAAQPHRAAQHGGGGRRTGGMPCGRVSGG